MTSQVVPLCSDTSRTKVSHLLWGTADLLQIALHHLLWSLAYGRDTECRVRTLTYGVQVCMNFFLEHNYL